MLRRDPYETTHCSEGEGPSPLTVYLQEVSEYALLSRDEEVALFQRLAEGDLTAKKEIANANLRLVISIARKYAGNGVSLQDLIQEGNIGLLIAIDRFNLEYNTRLSTYASWWIKQAIRRGLTKAARTIRVPVHTIEQLRVLKEVRKVLSTELRRTPTEEEVRKKMQITPEQMRELERVQLLKESRVHGSDADDPWTHLDMLADPAMGGMEQAMQSDQNARLHDYVERLNDREQMVISLRFGLEGNEQHTLKEVGERLGLTRERIRQIQNSAINKLRYAAGVSTEGNDDE